MPAASSPGTSERPFLSIPAAIIAESPASFAGFVAARSSGDQGKELKRVAAAIAASGSSTPPGCASELSDAELVSVGRWLADVCLLPRPYSFHSQVKRAVAALRAASADAGYAALADRLQSRLRSELLEARSLCPGDDLATPVAPPAGAALPSGVPPGALRHGSTPGWLELAFEIDPARDLLVSSIESLLRLVARSLSEIARAGTGPAVLREASDCAAELSRLVLLSTRHAAPALSDAAERGLVPPDLDGVKDAGGASGEESGGSQGGGGDSGGKVGGEGGGHRDGCMGVERDGRTGLAGGGACSGLGEALRAVCRGCDAVLSRNGLLPDAAIATAQARSHCLDYIRPRHAAAAALARFLALAKDDPFLVYAVRGVLQGASTETLLSPVAVTRGGAALQSLATHATATPQSDSAALDTKRPPPPISGPDRPPPISGAAAGEPFSAAQAAREGRPPTLDFACHSTDRTIGHPSHPAAPPAPAHAVHPPRRPRDEAAPARACKPAVAGRAGSPPIAASCLLEDPCLLEYPCLFGDSLLFGTLCPLVLSHCRATDLTVKLASFRALEGLMSHLEAISEGGEAHAPRAPALGTAEPTSDPTPTSIPAASPPAPPASVASPPNLPFAAAPRLLAFLPSAQSLIWDHWELPFPALATALPPLFRRILSLQAACLQGHPNTALTGRALAYPATLPSPPRPASLPPWFAPLLPQVRALSWSRKAKYRSLGVFFRMCPTGALPLTDAWPSLLPELFASLATPEHAGLATELLAEIATSLKQAEADISGRAEGGASSAEQAAAVISAHTSVATSEKAGVAPSPSSIDVACRSFWTCRLLSPMLDALASAGPAHADRVLQAALPAAVTADQRCLGWAMAMAAGGAQWAAPSAAAASAPPTTAPPSLSPEASVRLLIALLHTGRRLGIISAEQVQEMDRQAARRGGERVGDKRGEASADVCRDVSWDMSGDASSCARRSACRWPVGGSVLACALASGDDALLLDALDVLCSSRQLTEPPTVSDLRLVMACLELRLKGSPPEVRKGIGNRMRKFLVRCKAATFASAQLRRDLARLDAGGEQATAECMNGPSAAPSVGCMNGQWAAAGGVGGAALPRSVADRDPRALRHPARGGAGKGAERLALAAERREAAAHVATFLRWLGATLVHNLYPGCSYERAMLSLELYAHLIDTWAPPAHPPPLDPTRSPPAVSGAGVGPGAGMGHAAGAGRASPDPTDSLDNPDDPRASLAYPWTPGLADPHEHKTPGGAAGRAGDASSAPAGGRGGDLFSSEAALRLVLIISEHTFDAVRGAAADVLRRFPPGELPGIPAGEGQQGVGGQAQRQQWKSHLQEGAQHSLPPVPRHMQPPPPVPVPQPTEMPPLAPPPVGVTTMEALLNACMERLGSARAYESDGLAALLRLAVGRYVTQGGYGMRVGAVRQPGRGRGGEVAGEEDWHGGGSEASEDGRSASRPPDLAFALGLASRPYSNRAVPTATPPTAPIPPSAFSTPAEGGWRVRFVASIPQAAQLAAGCLGDAAGVGIVAGVGGQLVGTSALGRAITLLHDLSALAEECIRGGSGSSRGGGAWGDDGDSNVPGVCAPASPASSSPLQDGSGGSAHGALTALRAVLSEIEPLCCSEGALVVAPDRDMLRAELPPLLALAAAAAHAALDALPGQAAEAQVPMDGAGGEAGGGVGRGAVEGAGPVRSGPSALMGGAGAGSVADWGFISQMSGGGTPAGVGGQPQGGVGVGKGVAGGAGVPSAYVREGKTLVTRCWLTLKEAALLVKAVSRVGLPLPPAQARAAARAAETGGGGRTTACRRGGADAASRGDSELHPLLSFSTVDAAGQMLIRILLRTQHSGAIEMLADGLAELSHRALSSTDPATSALPGQWASTLLGVATGGGGGITHIRRSAGLPHALLAVLYAEQRAGSASRGDNAASMFADATRRLLARADTDEAPSAAPTHAKGASESAPHDASVGSGTASGVAPLCEDSDGRVHALNLLRSLFLDKAFGNPAQPFLASGFTCAFAALGSPRWPVRNSGLLLIAALLQRALRNRRQLGLRDFFARAPQLHPFLLARLRRSLGAADAGRGSEEAGEGGSEGGRGVAAGGAWGDAAAGSSGAGAAPSQKGPRGHLSAETGATDLFGVLSLFGCLVPSPAVSSSAPALDFAPFLPMVARCSALPTHKLRVAAARAVVALVPPEELLPYLASLADALPAETKNSSAKAGSSSACLGSPFSAAREGEHNRIHGMLLQMVELHTAANHRAGVGSTGGGDTATAEEAGEGGGLDAPGGSGVAGHAGASPSSDRASLRRLSLSTLNSLFPSLWMLYPSRQPCAPIRTAMFQVVGAALWGASVFDGGALGASASLESSAHSQPPARADGGTADAPGHTPPAHGAPPVDAPAGAGSAVSSFTGGAVVRAAAAAVHAAAQEALAFGSGSGVGADAARAQALHLHLRLRRAGVDVGTEPCQLSHAAPPLVSPAAAGGTGSGLSLDPLLLILLRDAQYESRLLGLYHARAALGLPPSGIDTDDVPVVPRGAAAGMGVPSPPGADATGLVRATVASCLRSGAGGASSPVDGVAASPEIAVPPAALGLDAAASCLCSLSHSLVQIVLCDSQRSCVLHAMVLLTDGWEMLGPALEVGDGHCTVGGTALEVGNGHCTLKGAAARTPPAAPASRQGTHFQAKDGGAAAAPVGEVGTAGEASTGGAHVDGTEEAPLPALARALRGHCHSPDAELHACALQLAACCAAGADAAKNGPGGVISVDEILNGVHASGGAECPELLRLGAVIALSRARLLVPLLPAPLPHPVSLTSPPMITSESPVQLSRQRVRAWLAVLRALDDDAQAVRDAAAEAASPLLAPSSVRLHPAAVMRLGWRRLAAAFPTCPQVVDALAKRVLGEGLWAGGAERMAVRRAMRRAAGLPVGGRRRGEAGAAGAGGAAGGIDARAGHIGAGGGEDLFEKKSEDGGDLEEDGNGGGKELFEKEADNMWEESVEQASSAAPLLRASLRACRAACLTTLGRAVDPVAGSKDVYRRGGDAAERQAAAGGEAAAEDERAGTPRSETEAEGVLLAAGRWREAVAGCIGRAGAGVTAVSFLWQSRARLAEWALAE